MGRQVGGGHSDAPTTVQLLLPMVHGHRWVLPGVVTLGALASLAEGVGIAMFIPLLETATVDAGGSAGSSPVSELLRELFGGMSADTRLLVATLVIAGMIAVRALLIYASQALFAWFEMRVGHDLRTRFFDHLMAVDYGYIERTDSGRLLNALSNETWTTTDALSYLVILMVNVLTAAIYVALLVALSWQLTLVVAIVMVAITLLVRFMTRQVSGVSAELTAENTVLATRMLDACSGAKVIRLFCREDHERHRFGEASWSVGRLAHRMSLAQATVGPTYELLAGGLLTAVLFVSLRNDPASLPSLLVFIVVLYRLQPRVRELDAIRVNLARSSGAVSEVARMIDPSDKPFMGSGGVDATRLEPTFRLRHLSFRYGSSEPNALDDITLDIPAHRTTALVGPSGAGKSTLIDMLVRLREPDSGSITFGDVPIADLDLRSLRRSIAVVSQDTYLFNATARENIAYGRPELTQEAIERASRLAHADEFVELLPDGYDTVLGDDGIRLSGGQRQRIALARAIICDPAVLVLDEATNALDSIAESVIQDALELLSPGRTVVIVAHRLATVRDADQIVVLDRGRIAERGTRSELIADGGLFATMSRLQEVPAS